MGCGTSRPAQPYTPGPAPPSDRGSGSGALPARSAGAARAPSPPPPRPSSPPSKTPSKTPPLSVERNPPQSLSPPSEDAEFEELQPLPHILPSLDGDGPRPLKPSAHLGSSVGSFGSRTEDDLPPLKGLKRHESTHTASDGTPQTEDDTTQRYASQASELSATAGGYRLGDPSVYGQIAAFVPPLVVFQIFKKMRQEPDIATQCFFQACLVWVRITGLDALAQGLNAADAAAHQRTASHIYSDILTSLSGYGGQCIKNMGDSLMVAFFGEAIPSGSASLRDLESLQGTQCTRALEWCQDSLRTPLDGEVSFSAVVSTGSITAHFVRLGSDDNDVFLSGPPVEEVSLVLAAAKPGSIYMSSTVKRVVDAHVDAEPCRERILFGYYRALGRRKDTKPLPRIDQDTLLFSEPTARRLCAYLPAPLTRAESPDEDPPLLRSGRMLRVSVVSIVMTSIFRRHKELAAGIRDLRRVLVDIQALVRNRGGSRFLLYADHHRVYMVVVFGAPPLVHDDDAARAVTFALSTRKVLEKHAIWHRVGVATGDAFIGPVGNNLRRDLAVLGAVFEVSRGLARVGQSGSVLVDKASADSASQFVPFTMAPLGVIPVGTSATPTSVLQADSWKPVVAQHSSLTALPTLGFVGLDSDVERATDIVMGSDDATRALIVRGGPGSGRSLFISRVIEKTADASNNAVKFWRTLQGHTAGRQAHFAEVFGPVIESIVGFRQGNGTVEDRCNRLSLFFDVALPPELIVALPLIADILSLDITTPPGVCDLLHPIEEKPAVLARATGAICRAAATQRTVLVVNAGEAVSRVCWSVLRELADSVPQLLLVVSMPNDDPLPALDGLASTEINVGTLGPDDFVRFLGLVGTYQTDPISEQEAADIAQETQGNRIHALHLLAWRRRKIPNRRPKPLQDCKDSQRGSVVESEDEASIDEAGPPIPAPVPVARSPFEILLKARLEELSPDALELLQLMATLGRQVLLSQIASIVETIQYTKGPGFGWARSSQGVPHTTESICQMVQHLAKAHFVNVGVEQGTLEPIFRLSSSTVMEVVRRTAPENLVVLVLTVGAQRAESRGEMRTTGEFWRRVVAHEVPQDFEDSQARSVSNLLRSLHQHYVYNGDFEGAHSCLDRALAVAEYIDNDQVRNQIRFNALADKISLWLSHERRPSAAGREAATSALEIIRSMTAADLTFHLPLAYHVRSLLVLCGNLDDAHYINMRLTEFESRGNRSPDPDVGSLGDAEIHFYRGKFANATDVATHLYWREDELEHQRMWHFVGTDPWALALALDTWSQFQVQHTDWSKLLDCARAWEPLQALGSKATIAAFGCFLCPHGLVAEARRLLADFVPSSPIGEYYFRPCIGALELWVAAMDGSCAADDPRVDALLAEYADLADAMPVVASVTARALMPLCEHLARLKDMERVAEAELTRGMSQFVAVAYSEHRASPDALTKAAAGARESGTLADESLLLERMQRLEGK